MTTEKDVKIPAENPGDEVSIFAIFYHLFLRLNLGVFCSLELKHNVQRRRPRFCICP